MTHLGDRVAALVDGQLSHSQRDRILAHVASCASCRTEVEAQRRLKERVASARGPNPRPELLHRLQEMAAPGLPLPPRRRTLRAGSSQRAATPTVRPPRAAGSTRRPKGRSHPFLRVAVMGTASVVVVALGTAFAVGGDATPPPGAPLTPPIDRYAVEHATTTGGVPLTDPAVGAVSVPFETGSLLRSTTVDTVRPPAGAAVFVDANVVSPATPPASLVRP